MIFRTWNSIAVIICLVASLASIAHADLTGQDRVETLGPVPDHIRKEFVAADGRSVAWLTDAPGGQALVLNGHADPVFSAIKSAPVISPDGKRMAYKVDADNGAKRAVVVDGKMGAAFETVNNDSIRFSPDSAMLDYTAGDSGKTLLIRDGKVLAGGTEIRSDAITSRDFQHLAYKVAVGEQRAVVRDGHQGPAFAQIDNDSIAFSSSGEHLIYVASIGSDSAAKVTVCLDSVPGASYDRVTGLMFSADGKHLAYIADQAGKECVVLDGKPGAQYDAIDRYFLRFMLNGTVGYRAQLGNQMLLLINGAPAETARGILDWSAAGQRTAFIGRAGTSWWVEANGKKSVSYKRVAAPLAFSPDGAHLVYAAAQGGHWAIVSDGQAGPAWDRVAQPPIFSADGSHWGCAAARGAQWFCLVDGKSYGPYNWLAWGTPQFSLKGGHFAYAAQSHDQWSVLLDGKPVATGDAPDSPLLRFSADGQHFACALKDDGQWHMIVDGIPGPAVDRLFDRVPEFLPDGSLEYLAIQGKTLVRVTHR